MDVECVHQYVQTYLKMDDDGKAKVIVDEVPAGKEDEAQEAESSCPVNAISVG